MDKKTLNIIIIASARKHVPLVDYLIRAKQKQEMEETREWARKKECRTL